MPKYTLPHFGEIDTTDLEEYYDVEIEFNGNDVSIDLNFEDKSIDTKHLDNVKKIIKDLATYDKQNVKYIEQDYKDEEADTVRTYIEHHLDEIDESELLEVIDLTDKTDKKEIQLMKALHLVRVGFYPHGEKIFATFDYSLDQDLTNYLVVINTDANGKLVYMTMES
jgi:hypothetical protein